MDEVWMEREGGGYALLRKEQAIKEESLCFCYI